MKAQVYDSPTRGLVESESDNGNSYLVDLSAFPIGPTFNGSCTCPHFVCSLAPKLKQPNNQFIHRCKHLRFYRENCLDMLLAHLVKLDKNIHEDHQV